ncbi:MAG: hypothetical protein ACJ8EA_23840, partial [Xanthobacteraceae bacterium]
MTRRRDDVAAPRAETHHHRFRRWWVSARHAAAPFASRARRLNPPYSTYAAAALPMAALTRG